MRLYHGHFLLSFFLLTVGMPTCAQTPATHPQSTASAVTAVGPTTVYLQYGMYDMRKQVFRRSHFFNISRPKYVPRPGNQVRTVQDVKVYASPVAKGSLLLGRLPLGTEVVVERVLRPSPKHGVLGYRGHALWIEAHVQGDKIEGAVPKKDDESWEKEPEG